MEKLTKTASVRISKVPEGKAMKNELKVGPFSSSLGEGDDPIESGLGFEAGLQV